MKLHGVTFFVPDIKAAADWYAEVLGSIPTFVSPHYIEFQLSTSMLGFHPEDDKNKAGGGSQVAYWKVENLDVAVRRLDSLGAAIYRGPITDHDGSMIAQMRDPFGNILGLIQK